MATFGELKAELSRKIQDRNGTAVSSLDVGAEINRSIQYWKRTRFWFNDRVGSVTVTANDPALSAFPVDFYRPVDDRAFRLQDNTQYYVLNRYDSSWFDATDPISYGMPTGWTYVNGNYYLIGYPDRTYPLTVRYLREYANLVSDSDTNDFTVYADRLILYDACARCIAEYRQDDKMETYFRNAANDEMAQLVSETGKRTATGILEIDY